VKSRLALLVALVAVLGACSTTSDDTWIGKNVGVAVDSGQGTTVPAATPAPAR
jgi:hypothetical protein